MAMNMNSGFEDDIRRALELRVQEIVEEEAKKAAESVTRRVKELAPIVAANLSRRMDFEYLHDRVVLTVRLDDRTTPRQTP